MPRADFYNQNMYRLYPLYEMDAGAAGSCPPGHDGELWLQNRLLCDLDVTINPQHDYSYDDTIQLYSFTKSGTDITFTFRVTISGAVKTFTVERDVSDEFITYSEYSDDDITVFAVTGILTDAASVADGTYCPVGGRGGYLAVEPQRIHPLAGNSVTSINLANEARTKADDPECDPTTTDVPSTTSAAGEAIVAAEDLTGHVKFVEGYNASVGLSESLNLLTLGSRIGAGAGQPCGEIPLTPEEEMEPGLLSGGPACSDVVFTLNGIQVDSRGNFLLLGSRGLEVESYPDDHMIIIRANVSESVICR